MSEEDTRYCALRARHAGSYGGAPEDMVRVTRGPNGRAVAHLGLDEAMALAAGLLEAATGGAGLPIVATCPLCRSGLLVVDYDPGSPGHMYMPNGDPGYPPEPAYIAGLEATCGCWPESLVDEVFGAQDHPVYAELERIVAAVHGIQGWAEGEQWGAMAAEAADAGEGQ